MTLMANGPIETLAQADLLLLAARTYRVSSARDFGEVEAEAADELAARSGLSERAGGWQALRDTLAAVASLDADAWSAERIRLFDGPTLCPPNETAFVRRDKGAILGDVCGFYHAFGFDLVPEAGEKADHVVTELEFAAMLLVLLARARGVGNREAESVTYDALAAFVRDHLDEWIPSFCERLEQATALPLYDAAGRLLLDALETVIERQGLPRAVRDPAALPAAEPGTPYECGMAAPCEGVSGT